MLVVDEMYSVVGRSTNSSVTFSADDVFSTSYVSNNVCSDIVLFTTAIGLLPTVSDNPNHTKMYIQITSRIHGEKIRQGKEKH